MIYFFPADEQSQPLAEQSPSTASGFEEPYPELPDDVAVEVEADMQRAEPERQLKRARYPILLPPPRVSLTWARSTPPARVEPADENEAGEL